MNIYTSQLFFSNPPGSHAVRGNPYLDAPASRDAGASYHAFPRITPWMVRNKVMQEQLPTTWERGITV
ncbi:MAG: hypothetical protein ACKE51_04620 [Methylococcaceae bacterium]